MAAAAAAYRSLTDAQRAGWAALGAGITRSDSLGQTYTLTGLQAYALVNIVTSITGGAAISDAPVLSVPDALATITAAGTIATLTVAFTPTPLPAGLKGIVYASPQTSAGRNFQADLRLLQVTAAAAASPVDCFASYTARFGPLAVGQKVFFAVSVTDGKFESIPTKGSCVIA